MELRVRGLSAIDPMAVPLPNGTEVVTRVSRVMEGRRPVPEGAIGRVISQRDGELDVMVVGVGVLRYARSELVPHKIGQARYARRRAHAWEALSPCAVLSSTVGSRAWGLAEEGSDTDLRGVFVLPFAWTLGLGEPPRDLVSEDGSVTFWEAGKAVRQALRADPNTLEMLFVDSVRITDPMGAWIVAERDAFVSAEIYGSFGRYALSQLKRLAQSQRLAEHRATVLEWLREDPAPTLDQVAARLAELSPKEAPSEADAILTAKDYVKQLYRSLYDQGLLEGRTFASLVRFAREDEHRFDLPRELRPKNAYNLVRLIGTAIGWLRTGRPELEARGELRELLLGIKRGQVPLRETLREAEARAKELDAARRATALPASPDVARADALLCRIGAEAARRALSREPGPFGLDAPARPDVVLADVDEIA